MNATIQSIRKLLSALVVALMLGLPAAAGAAEADGGVYIIPIREMIEPALLYVIRRGVADAEARNARAVIFTMDTPGGTVQAAEDIIKTIEFIAVPTYTYVEKNAISAGAIIALATDHIYMAPGSKIGDAMPIMMSPIGGAQEPAEGIEEKMVSYVAALIRSTAQNAGHDDQLAEAMVRREMEYKIGDEVISPEGQLLTLTNVEAERKVGEDLRPLLSSGTVESLDALLEQLNLADAEIQTLQITAAEKVARYIAAMASVFLIIGLLGLYLEIKTPGFGLPGAIGIVSLAIFFWGHHIAGLTGLEDLALFAIGLMLLLIELFVIPGFGIVGLLGLVFMLGGLLMAMVQHYPGTPVWPEPAQLQIPVIKMGLAFFGSLAGAVIIGRIFPHTPLFGKLVLTSATDRKDGFQAASAESSAIGTVGRTLTPCNPGGSARFDGKRCDVISQGQFIPSGAAVRIIKPQGGRYVVEPAEDLT